MKNVVDKLRKLIKPIPQ